MHELRRLATLTRDERGLLFRAFIVVAVTRATLWLLPLKKVRRAAKAVTAGISDFPSDRLIWAVKAVSRRVPQATCLTQALAVEALFSRAGYEAVLEVGVARDTRDRFEAHAWVRSGAVVVIGGPDVARYVPLTTFQR